MHSQVVQIMKLYSECCLFVFSKVYTHLSDGRENFSETAVHVFICLSVVSSCRTYSGSHFGRQEELSFHVALFGFVFVYIGIISCVYIVLGVKSVRLLCHLSGICWLLQREVWLVEKHIPSITLSNQPISLVCRMICISKRQILRSFLNSASLLLKFSISYYILWHRNACYQVAHSLWKHPFSEDSNCFCHRIKDDNRRNSRYTRLS